MTTKIDVADAAEYADLEQDEVKDVLCYLIDNGWLFSSHARGDVWAREEA